METQLFYTSWSEWGKILFYLALFLMLITGVIRKKRGHADWYVWIDAAVYAHFLMGVAYSGLRMVATDEVEDIFVRRIFAWEAWFNGACAAFYFLFREYISVLKRNSR